MHLQLLGQETRGTDHPCCGHSYRLSIQTLGMKQSAQDLWKTNHQLPSAKQHRPSQHINREGRVQGHTTPFFKHLWQRCRTREGQEPLTAKPCLTLNCQSSRCAWLAWDPQIQEVNFHIRAAQKTCLCPTDLHCGSANASWHRTGPAMKYINAQSQFLSTPTVPGWRASEFLNHRHTSPAWLCKNTTRTHRISYPDLTCAQQRATELQQGFQAPLWPANLEHRAFPPPAHQGICSSSCKQPQRLLIPGDTSSLSSQSWAHTASQFSPSKHSSARLQAPQERWFWCGRVCKTQDCTNPFAFPELCWHVELMLNYPEWFINI